MPSAINVSVVSPVSLAVRQVQRALFQPFDLRKWFLIGFGAWLANLGEAGFNFNFNFRGRSMPIGDIRQEFERARDYVLANLGWIVPLAVFVVVAALALAVVMLWAGSRGKFMFLQNVALERAEVAEPWKQFAQAGNSLFWFRVVLWLAGTVVMLPVLVLGVWVGVKMFQAGDVNATGVLTLVGIVVVLIVVSVVYALISKFTTDFVVPIMYLRGRTCRAAWGELLGLMMANAGSVGLYLLFQIVIALATGALVFMVVIVTCCTAGCLLVIPYLGTVVLLPVLMFKRSYSLHYLAQYGREYDVFPPTAAPSV